MIARLEFLTAQLLRAWDFGVVESANRLAQTRTGPFNDNYPPFSVIGQHILISQMPTKATVKLISLRNCLVNLPLTLYSQLSEKGVAPQNLVVELSWQGPSKQKLSVGWTGMPARIVGLRSARVQGTSVENIELDAQFAKQVNLTDGQQVTIDLRMATPVATSISISPLSVDDWEILVCCVLAALHVKITHA